MQRRLARMLGVVAIASLAQSAVGAEEVATVRLTEKVLVKDVERLGVHFGGDNFYDSAILKQRVAENFEGTVRRLHVAGDAPQPDPTGLYLHGVSRFLQSENFKGAKAYVLSGPDLFQVRTVVAVEERDHVTSNRQGKTHFVKLDKPVRWGTEWMNGLLIDNTDIKAGQRPWQVEKRRDVDGRREWYTDFEREYVTPETVDVAIGDAPPEVGGNASAVMRGGHGESWMRFRVQFNDAAPYAGEWSVHLWARTTEGAPTLTVKPTVQGTSVSIKPGEKWQKHSLKLKVDVPKAGTNPILMLEVRVEEGTVLVDNIEASRDGDGSNPTAFRDELVNAMRPLNAGSIRYLRNDRNSFLNSVLPRIESATMRDQHGRRSEFGTHEFYALCQHLNADPWSTLPGTILPDEMDQVMEYHAAPANVGLGKLRARLGQEKPWTDVFHRIHLQFGNEVVTFGGTGYQGPDYWEALVRRAKGSPYYDPEKFVFHLNEQGGGLKRLFSLHPSFDRGTINGYHVFGVYRDQVETAKDVPGFYEWVYASAWHMWLDQKNNRNWNNLQTVRDLGKELSIYEGGNYHSTFSSPEDAPVERINRMLAGKTGGVSAVNTMLILLKNYGARTQQNFNLSQHEFKPGGSFGNLPAAIRGWGGILNIGSDETRRYRPRFLALAVANEVIGGDLVETQASGVETFDVANRFGAGYGPSRNPEAMTVTGVPRVHAYGFVEGDRRGVLLVSNDPRNSRRLKLEFDGQVDGAVADVWLLEGADIESTNELDWAAAAPEVSIKQSKIEGFKSGSTVDLPAGTIVAVEWKIAR